MATTMKGQHQGLLPPADLAGEIERVRDELRNERDRNLRTLADFKNYRRRIERDGNKLGEKGKRAIILSLLDIADDMERALHWVSNGNQPSAKGVRFIHEKLLALLRAHGVLPFDSVGATFNPDRHEAVAMANSEDSDGETVVDEFRRGYLWNNELLRPAQVRVAG